MGGLWKELQRTENWETTRVTGWCLLTESHKERRACGPSPSSYGVKLEGQRTWGAAETERKINLMVYLERKNSETCQLRHSCREGQGRAAAKGAVREGRLRATEMAEEGITATFVMFVIPLFGTELVHFQPFL